MFLLEMPGFNTVAVGTNESPWWTRICSEWQRWSSWNRVRNSFKLIEIGSGDDKAEVGVVIKLNNT